MNWQYKKKNGIQTVSARELYEKLEITDRFSRWFDSLLKYGFEDGTDFTSVKTSTLVNNGAKKELDDYAITIEMAKQICMLQRSEKGRQYREYFITLEKAWNSPEAIMSRALQIANETLDKCKKQVVMLEAENAEKEKQLIEQAPKVDFYNCVTGSKDTMDMKEVAKVLNYATIGRNKLFELLRLANVLDRNNLPYQKYVDAGYFRIIESRYTMPDGETKISLKTVVFQKGIDFIKNVIDKTMQKMRKE